MLRSAENPGEIAGTLIGSSAAALELREETELAARFNGRVMISGEYGVGKQRLAKLIHRQSVRCDAPFIAIACANAPEAQLEIQLFGGRNNAGALERADSGIVFLEDVDALSPALQARLMRSLATGDIQPVGRQTIRRRVNGRIVCATTARLFDKIATGHFRQDLYYLLNTIYIPVPPLRERTEDVEPLLDFFTAYYARRYGLVVPQLSLESRASCRACDWPANLRQLQAAAAIFVLPTRPLPPAQILESAARIALYNRLPSVRNGQLAGHDRPCAGQQS